jgi:hypothetical protein
MAWNRNTICQIYLKDKILFTFEKFNPILASLILTKCYFIKMSNDLNFLYFNALIFQLFIYYGISIYRINRICF